MIPIRDVIPSRTTPYVTIGLLLANACVFLLAPASGAALDAFADAWGIVPVRFTLTSALTALFVHAGATHLLVDLLFLWIFGENVEDRLGHWRFLAFYVLCGLAAALLHAAVQPGSPVPAIGATGAIAGVLGAYLVLFPESRVLTYVILTLVEVPAVFLLVVWFTLHLLGGLGALPLLRSWDLGGLALPAHVGAFATGAALVLLLRRQERMRVEWWDRLAH